MTVHPRICVGVVTVPERGELLRRLFFDLSKQTVRPSEVVIVEQDGERGRGSSRPTDLDLPLSWRTNRGRNLSAARNVIIEHAGSDVLMLMDDDARMPEESIERVTHAFTRHADAAAITFMVEWVGHGRRRPYPSKEAERTTVRALTSVASIEVAVSLPMLRKKGIRFDERFGLGAPFPTGEELVLLADLLRAGGRIVFVREIVASHPAQTAGARRDLTVLRARGALFRRLFGDVGLAVALAQIGRGALRGELGVSPFSAARAVVDGWSRLRGAGEQLIPSD